MGKKDRERIGRVLDRLAALEGRLEALEAKRRAFTSTTGQSKMLEMEDRVREALAQRDKAEARVKELEARMDPDPEWMRERLQRYTGSPEQVDDLVKAARRTREYLSGPVGAAGVEQYRALTKVLEPFERVR